MPKRASSASILVALKKQQADIAREEKKASELAANLVEKVKAGESTGDLVADFVIRRHGEVKPQYEERLWEIGGLISGHTGDLVLAVCNRIRDSEILGGGRFCFIDEDLFVAELAKDELDLDLEKGGLPCARYVKTDSLTDQNQIRIIEGNIPWSLHFTRDLVGRWGKKMEYRLTPYHLGPEPPELEIELHIGQEAILAWADAQAYDIEGRINLYHILLWVMARAIGHPLPECEDVKKKRGYILKAIEEGLIEAKALKLKINRVINRSAPDSKDEVQMRTYGMRQDLETKISTLGRFLEEARILGASEEELAPFQQEIEKLK